MHTYIMKYYIVIFCFSFNLLVSAKVNIISNNGFQGRGFPSSKMMYENALAIKEKIENFNMMFFGKNMALNLKLNPEDPDPKGTVHRLDSKPISTLALVHLIPSWLV